MSSNLRKKPSNLGIFHPSKCLTNIQTISLTFVHPWDRTRHPKLDAAIPDGHRLRCGVIRQDINTNNLEAKIGKRNSSKTHDVRASRIMENLVRTLIFIPTVNRKIVRKEIINYGGIQESNSVAYLVRTLTFQLQP